jgi:hypothetical protein
VTTPTAGNAGLPSWQRARRSPRPAPASPASNRVRRGRRCSGARPTGRSSTSPRPAAAAGHPWPPHRSWAGPPARCSRSPSRIWRRSTMWRSGAAAPAGARRWPSSRPRRRALSAGAPEPRRQAPTSSPASTCRWSVGPRPWRCCSTPPWARAPWPACCTMPPPASTLEEASWIRCGRSSGAVRSPTPTRPPSVWGSRSAGCTPSPPRGSPSWPTTASGASTRWSTSACSRATGGRSSTTAWRPTTARNWPERRTLNAGHICCVTSTRRTTQRPDGAGRGTCAGC